MTDLGHAATAGLVVGTYPYGGNRWDFPFVKLRNGCRHTRKFAQRQQTFAHVEILSPNVSDQSSVCVYLTRNLSQAYAIFLRILEADINCVDKSLNAFTL